MACDPGPPPLGSAADDGARMAAIQSTIYKVADRGLVRNSPGRGRFCRRPGRPEGRLHPLFDRSATCRNAAASFRGQRGPRAPRPSAPPMSARTSNGSPRAAAALPASLRAAPMSAVVGSAPISVAADGNCHPAGLGPMIFSALSPLLKLPAVASLTRDTLLRWTPRPPTAPPSTRSALALPPQQTEPDPPELKTTLAASSSTIPSAWPPASTRMPRSRGRSR